MRHLLGIPASLQFALILALLSSAVHAQVVLSEFLASNSSSITDEDGTSSDWIELFNASTNVIDLAGWHLTDRSTNLTAWTFPQTLIQPGSFLIVFASEKNRAVSGSEQHTNFQLSRSGEYLALVKPNLSIATEFSPAFPEVQPDEAYGFPMSASETIVIDETDAVQWLVPTNNNLGLTWTTANFDDSSWNSGIGGVGYEDSSGYQNLINSLIPTDTVTVYTRFTFNLPSVPSWNGLRLRMKYDDGFIAYLNGGYIDGANEPAAAPTYNSTSTGTHDDNSAIQFEDFNASHRLPSLQSGNNTLAVHGLNGSTGSSDMLMRLQLVAGQSSLNGAPHGRLTTPTPGAPNPSGIATPILFSEENQLFANTLSIALSSTLPDVDIYYTTNGSVPTTNDTQYTSPILITTRTILKASVAFADGSTSDPETRRYIKVDPDVLGFDSSLPLVVIDTFNSTIPDTNPGISVFALIEPDPTSGRSSLVDDAAITSTATLAIRGSSSAGFPKKQYKMELVDETLTETGANLLGLGKESDWILYAPGQFDHNMIANNFMYELGRDMGQVTMGTRFVEVFLNDNNDTVSTNDYDGIYVLMESIKIDQNRVDIAQLDPANTTQPHVSGGYILSVDRGDNNQYVFNTDPQNLMPDANNINVIDPKNDALNQAQKDAIRDYSVATVNALYGPNPEHPTTGYPAFIDVDAWADYHMLNTLAHNVDAFRLSGYYYKDRNGPIVAGPQWDFDRTLSSTDGRDDDPTNIRGVGGSTLYYEYGWWDGLFDREEFRIRYQDNWYAWRRSQLLTTALFQRIDALEAQIHAAYARPGNNPLDESSRWNIGGYGSRYGFGNLIGERDALKTWLGTRLNAMDDSFGKPPVLNQHGGTAPPGFDLAISLPAGAAGTIYYTLDGSDPRLPGGSVATNAQVYAGPIDLVTSTRLLTRIQYSSGNEVDFPFQRTVDWSAKAETTFNIDPPASSNNLAITEIHYNPYPPDALEQQSGYTDPDEYEFIELMNVSASAIDLSGVAFTNGISFNFDGNGILLLGPGERIILTPEEDAFAARYPGVAFAGRYNGQLGNTGETLSLIGRNSEAIQTLQFQDLSLSDGLGHSLIVLAGAEGSSEASDWRPSCELHGTPTSVGSTDCRNVVINEVLAHTDAPLTDLIELYNPGPDPVDISNWWLSDALEYQKFQIPPGTVLPAGAHLSFDEQDFNPNGAWNANPTGPIDTNRHFALSASMGDEVYLVEADASGQIIRVADAHAFRATLNGESLGRFDNGDGPFYPMTTLTEGSENGHVRTGPLVITEIMYNPTPGTNDFDLEYIELGNIGSTIEDLADWQLEGAVDYTFQINTPIHPGETRVIVGFDPTSTNTLQTFQNAYGAISPLGPWSGHLNNAGETLWLLRADDSPAGQPGFRPLVEEERVSYLLRGLWDIGADGTGMALGRLVQSQFADTNSNWSAQAPSPGSMPLQVWLESHFTLSELGMPISGLAVDADGDGLSNESEYLLGTDPRDALSGLLIAPMGSPFTLRWPSTAGRCYHIGYRASLGENVWQRLPNTRVFGTGGMLEWTDTDPVRTETGTTGYYILIVN
jgi:hypothetical protein